jgi:hypothetical protein
MSAPGVRGLFLGLFAIPLTTRKIPAASNTVSLPTTMYLVPKSVSNTPSKSIISPEYFEAILLE